MRAKGAKLQSILNSSPRLELWTATAAFRFEAILTITFSTTNLSGNTGVTGLVVYETNRNEATWYHDLKGFNVPSAAISAMESCPGNRVNKYHVESLQLVQIFGELTYFGVYATPLNNGQKGFGGICLVHARSQNPSEVIVAMDKSTALQHYATQLAERNLSSGKVSQTADLVKEKSAKVVGIAQLPNSETATYLFKVEGERHSFTVTRETYGDIPLVEKGDIVVFTYVDIHQSEVPVSTFHCARLDNVGTEPEKAAK